MASYKWKREEVMKLIEMVEARNCLWNVASQDYHNQVKRRNCFAEIAVAFNVPVEEVKRKIHILRAQHSKERSKMNVKKSGSGSSETYQTKWEYFGALQFMFRHTEETKTTSSMSSDVNADCNMVEYNQELLESNQPQEIEELANESLDEPIATTSSSTGWPIIQSVETLASSTPKKRKKKNDSSIELQEQAAINRCMMLLSSATPRDEFSDFGEHVGNELRLLRTAPHIQCQLKNDIQRLLTNAGWDKIQFDASRASETSSPNSDSANAES